MARGLRTGRKPADKEAPPRQELGLDDVDEASAASMDASDPPAFGGVTGVGGGEDYGDERRRRISERAHELWREAGAPEGVALDFWLAAERELDAGRGYSGAGS
jgi:hypothetical protein